MKSKNKKYNRRSIRLENYDYTQKGTYFITICTYKKKCIFGFIKNNKMFSNEYGDVVSDYWYKIPEYFQNASIDEFIIMPNHVHGILIIHYDSENTVGSATLSRCQTPTTKHAATISTGLNNPRLYILTYVNAMNLLGMKKVIILIRKLL